MSKTPEELAEEYLRKMWGHDGDPTEEMHCVSDFLAGYQAGYNEAKKYWANQPKYDVETEEK